MENFIVSARKYRPPVFNMVVGQKNITSTLKNAIKKDQLAQAFLFCGPRGVGKTTCARILAKTINCQNITDQYEACGQCPSCLSFEQNASFNMHELDAASNNSVDDIRNLVDQVRIPPQAGKYKVYIIDEVHMLSASAFNAFLKTLEEPPHYAKFILATTEKHKIIPTILSRCQIFDFRRITVDDITEHLEYVAKQEGIQAEHLALHMIAQKSDGALRDALSIFDQIASSTEGNITYQSVLNNLNILDYEYYFSMTGNVLRGDIAETLLLIDKIIDNGFDGLQFVSGFSAHLRNLMVCKDEKTIGLLEVSNSIKDDYSAQSRLITSGFLMKAMEIASNCEVNYKTSNNKRLHLELTFLNICALSGPAPADAGNMQPEAEKKSPDAEESPKINPATVEQETPAKPEVRPKAVLKKADVISIKKPLDTKDGSSQAAEPQLVYENRTFTEDEMLKVWADFAAGIRDAQPHLYSTLNRRKPSLKEGGLLELIVDNKVQQDEITEKRGDILTFLRKELNNGNISLEAVVTESGDDDRKHLSPEEKFHIMAGKNPVIKDLKTKLDLEIDY